MINSPFDLKILALKHMDKTTDMSRKINPKTLLKSCEKQSKGTPIYRLPKYGRWRPTQQEILLSVDRPVDRPTVRFLTVVPVVDWPVNRDLNIESSSSPPIDRGHFQRAELSGGRSGRSTGPPAYRACARSCTSVDRTGRPTSTSVDRPVDRQKARSILL